MLTIYRNKICYPLILSLMITFLPVFSSAEVYPEKTGETWIKKVKLKKNARANGFKIIRKGSDFYFEAVKVTDPGKKKLVEGETQLEYRCEGGNLITAVKVLFNNGNSIRIKVECIDLINPQIIIMDEEEQPLLPK